MDLTLELLDGAEDSDAGLYFFRLALFHEDLRGEDCAETAQSLGVKVPQGLREIGVLLEPLTVVEKGIAQAYEIQRRLRVWRPRRAAVIGAGAAVLGPVGDLSESMLKRAASNMAISCGSKVTMAKQFVRSVSPTAFCPEL